MKTRRLIAVLAAALAVTVAEAKDWPGFSRGMGMGG